MRGGRAAREALNRMCATADVAQAGAVSALCLADDGTVNASVDVADAGGGESFLVMAAPSTHRRVGALLRGAIAACPGCSVDDVTGAFARLELLGPLAMAVLSTAAADGAGGDAPAAAAAAALARGCAAEVDLGLAKCVVARFGGSGGEGCTVLVPSEAAEHVHELLLTAGAGHGLVHAGAAALESLALERGGCLECSGTGGGLCNTDGLWSVGGAALGGAVRKQGVFRGRAAVLAALGVPTNATPAEAVAAAAAGGAADIPQRFVRIVLRSPQPLMHGSEVLLRNGEVVGTVRCVSCRHRRSLRECARWCHVNCLPSKRTAARACSVASYGHTLGAAVGVALVARPGAAGGVSREWLEGGAWSVDIAGVQHAATAPALV